MAIESAAVKRNASSALLLFIYTIFLSLTSCNRRWSRLGLSLSLYLDRYLVEKNKNVASLVVVGTVRYGWAGARAAASSRIESNGSSG